MTNGDNSDDAKELRNKKTCDGSDYTERGWRVSGTIV